MPTPITKGGVTVDVVRVFELILERRCKLRPEEYADWLDRLELMLRTLRVRYAFVFRQRVMRDPPRLLRQVAEILGVTGERVRQLQLRALRKLRHPARRSHLGERGDVAETLHAVEVWASSSAPGPAAATAHLPHRGNRALLLRLEDVDLPTRAWRCVERLNLTFLGDLAQRTERDVFLTGGIGRKTLRQVREILALYGLHLGMQVPDWEKVKEEALCRPAGRSCSDDDPPRRR